MLLQNRPNHIVETLTRLKGARKKIVLYGAGYCGYETLRLFAAHGIEVAAICDDFRAGERLGDFTIAPIDAIQPAEDLRIFITSGFDAKMKERLAACGLLDFYDPTDFGRYEPEKENYAYLSAHEKELASAESLLADEKSQGILERLANYRISRDRSLLANLQDAGEQYFPHEQSLDLSAGGGTFLDLGAYDGDSAQAFLRYVHGDYAKLIAVEASAKNFARLKQNLAACHDVELHNVGVHSGKGTLRFVVSDAKNSFAADDGTETLAVDSVDNILAGQPVTFLKSDIEGAEYAMLAGAAKTIQKNHPILALSCYHVTEDLWRLQLAVERLAPHAYRYYLRHYSPTVIETVLYAVPV